MTLGFAPETIELWPLERLRPYAQNTKTHGPDQVAQIAASIAEFGWTVPVLVADDGEVIAGHGRILAATELGLTEAPVIVLGHLSEAQRRAYRIADNKLTELGGWDEALLSAELKGLLAEEFDLSLIGIEDGELDRLLREVETGGAAGDTGGVPPVVVPEPPRNPVSHTGDLWILGDYRLLCGDRTSVADVRRLMNSEHAALFATESAVPRRLRRLEPSDAEQELVRVVRHDLGRQQPGRRALQQLHRRRDRRGDHGGRSLVLLARLAPPGDARGLLGKGGRLRPPADHLGGGSGRADPVALPLEARALPHGLGAAAPPAEGSRRDAALGGRLKQSRLMSLVEAIANVVVGYGIAVLTQLIVFPWFGLPARVGDALAIGAVFTLVSLVRGFALRRLFERLRVQAGTSIR